MQTVIMFICLAVMLIASVAAAMLWSRITAAMCLALTSVSLAAVSYTHLDVYKRQMVNSCHVYARNIL